MINNLLQPPTSNQPGVRPHDLTQPVVNNLFSPTPDQNPSKSDAPQHFVLDNSADVTVDTSCWQLPVLFDGGDNSFITNTTPYNVSPQTGSGDATGDLVPDFTGQPYQVYFGDDNISDINHINKSMVSYDNPSANPSANPLGTMHELPQEVELIGSEGGAGGQVLFRYDKHDEKIITATLKSVQSGSLTPLIKEELRCTIQSRRLAEGKGELKVEFKSPPRKKDMTEDERKRAVKRRLQNREAAQRFRQKQKDTSDYLTGKIRRLETTSNNLIADLKRLKEERDELQEMLKNHLSVCTSHVQTVIDVNPQLEEFLHDLHNKPTQSAIVTTTSQCTDSGDSSCESVFFLEDESQIPKHDTINYESIIIDQIPKNDTHSYKSIIIDQSQLCFEGSMLEDLNAPIDVFYEEVVVDESHSSTDDNNRLESCSSVGAASSHGSYSPAKICLSDSTGSLRDSFQSESSRTHTNSSSSDQLDAVYMEEDFFWSEDCLP